MNLTRGTCSTSAGSISYTSCELHKMTSLMPRDSSRCLMYLGWSAAFKKPGRTWTSCVYCKTWGRSSSPAGLR